MTDLNHSRNLAGRRRAGRLHVSFLLTAVITATGLMAAARATAQTLRILHGFMENVPFMGNSDGANPSGGLVLSGNTLYGTAENGGNSGDSPDSGTVFKVNVDGTGFTNVYRFSPLQRTCLECVTYWNGDGAGPAAGLVLSGTILYGTAQFGGLGRNGTVFRVNTDGTGFMNLHSFTGGNDGANPYAGLILSGDTLYGTARSGGASGNGTVFAVKIDGMGFTNLYSFTAIRPSPSGAYTNSDGAYPVAALTSSGSTLYGTTCYGGVDGYGTVFRVNPDGTDFTSLYSFTRRDGTHPSAGLILASNTLYGTSTSIDSGSSGRIFKLNTDGTGFTNLYSLSIAAFDAYYSLGGLILSGNTLYGTAGAWGSSHRGAVFTLRTDGTGFKTLYSFTPTSAAYSGTNGDGAFPEAGLILSGNTLYGTASGGGGSGNGTVFSLSFTPQLTITPSPGKFMLSWPTNYAGFDYSGYALQSTTNLGSSAVWGSNSPAPVVVNGQNTVANPISATQRFFRLKQ
jgi:uncharacterized repeat protein (TIGR03803 family)